MPEPFSKSESCDGYVQPPEAGIRPPKINMLKTAEGLRPVVGCFVAPDAIFVDNDYFPPFDVPYLRPIEFRRNVLYCGIFRCEQAQPPAFVPIHGKRPVALLVSERNKRIFLRE